MSEWSEFNAILWTAHWFCAGGEKGTELAGDRSPNACTRNVYSESAPKNSMRRKINLNEKDLK
jgi:hypothetical protein